MEVLCVFKKLFSKGIFRRGELVSQTGEYKVVVCYVKPEVLSRLKGMASLFDLPLHIFCGLCLECVDPVKLVESSRRAEVPE